MNHNNSKMKKLTKTFLIIEIQIVLIILVFVLIKLDKLNHRVFNTNKFVYELLNNKKTETINKLFDHDIVIGEKEAPVTIFLYSRFDCSACNDFFTLDYKKLKNDFIDNGKAKMVIRYLTHSSKPESLYATKGAYYSFKNAGFDSYIEQLSNQFPILDSISVKEIILGSNNDKITFDSFMKDEIVESRILKLATTVRNTGIRSTPTFFINDRQITGNQNYEKIKKAILNEMEK